MRIRSLAVLLSLVCATLATAVPASSAGPRPPGRGADAVLALVDTGINPYHVVFRDGSARAYKHPSTYLPGYPKSAKALRITLNEDDYWKAVRADCKRVWSKVKPGRLYWFPGTKIVGAITFEPPTALNCKAQEPSAGGHILDENGHGTMVASRAAANSYGACPKCLITSVQFPGYVPLGNPGASTAWSVDAIKWAARNSNWIDAQSNSWGPVVPAWEPTGEAGLLTSNPRLVRAVESVSRKHLAFWASGNGAAFRAGVVGHPTLLASHMTPHAIMVGGHDSGYVNTWPGFPPHLVSDSCASWAAHEDEVKKSEGTVGSGTSGATPFAAGGAARVLLRARQILGDSGAGVHGRIVARGPAGIVDKGPLADGKLTLNEWKTLVFKTATPRPKRQHEDGPTCNPGLYGPTPIKWEDIPREYPEYVHIGYGAVDEPAYRLAKKVLAGRKELPARSETDAFFAGDRRVREATYPIFSGGDN